jgi:enoyl-CoA hydratase/carnithine racemase
VFEVEIVESVATVTLNRAPVNAMNDAWVSDFHRVLDRVAGQGGWSTLLLRSGLKNFSAGADLQQMKNNFDLPPEVQAAVGGRYQELFDRIERLSQITIAEIRGSAMGGGLELALSCDFRIAAKNARIGLPEVTLGVIPGAGGTQRLTKLCGKSLASRLILGAEIISGEEACCLGLTQWSVDEADLESAARKHAARIAALPLHALSAAKECIAVASSASQRGYDLEVEKVRGLLGDLRTKALIEAFLNR